MFAGRTEEIVAAGGVDQLGHPVAAGHQRLDPFDEGDTRLRPAGDLGADGFDPALHLVDQFFARRRATERIGNPADVGVNVCGGVGFQRYDADRLAGPGAGGGLHVTEAHRADLAMILGDDYIGRQRFQGVAVDAIDREAVAHDFLHAAVDLRTGALHLEFRRSELRQSRDARGEVALVAASDQPVAAAQRAHDLGGAGDQTHDAALRTCRSVVLRGTVRRGTFHACFRWWALTCVLPENSPVLRLRVTIDERAGEVSCLTQLRPSCAPPISRLPGIR